ncbi:single-stranded telomeric DNA-binding/mRNA-binding protein [Starmerella bacillaris]|uniref:Single-stranded telomeric DNA-binding/mRNA-binding protein n=1 Tax=Starmerella bacillaris TaxID=1247836 RepID=A0AAV5RDU5_STABA|nr:single-stranded telomeric DNA-binding/mRNA-binding protein [Starmerella bacillaris]
MATVYPRVFISNLPFNLDAAALKNAASQAGNVTWSKVYQNSKGKSAGTGTVQYDSMESAMHAVQVLSGSTIGSRTIQVKPSLWSSGNDDVVEETPTYSVFVSNLPYSANVITLNEIFSKAGEIVKSVVYTDSLCRSKGIGTVSYNSAAEAENAMKTLNGTKIQDRVIMVRAEREKRNVPFDWCTSGGEPGDTLFISNLPFHTTSETLDKLFEKLENISRLQMQEFAPKVFAGSAVVRFYTDESAKEALKALENKTLDGRKLYVTYARYPESN